MFMSPFQWLATSARKMVYRRSLRFLIPNTDSSKNDSNKIFFFQQQTAEVVVSPEGESLLETNGNYKELKKPDGISSPATPVKQQPVLPIRFLAGSRLQNVRTVLNFFG
jgi:hypothetical protein